MDPLKPLLEEIHRRGLMGLVISHQGCQAKPFKAMCVGRNTGVCTPETWRTYDTPEEAIDELCDIFRVRRVLNNFQQIPLPTEDPKT